MSVCGVSIYVDASAEGYGGFIQNEQFTEKKDKELGEIYSQVRYLCFLY